MSVSCFGAAGRVEGIKQLDAAPGELDGVTGDQDQTPRLGRGG